MMKAFVLAQPGFEKLVLEEIRELVNIKGKKAGRGVVEFSGEKEELAGLCFRGQSFRRMIIGGEKFKEASKADFSKINWDDYLGEGASFKVEIEGLKGNENRIKLSKELSRKIFSANKGKELRIDFRKAEAGVLVFFDSRNYFWGIDFGGKELNKRDYRVFVHSASIKGDLGYYLVRKSGFQRGERLGVGGVKDGTLAIEAALFNSEKQVNRKGLAFKKFPMFKNFEGESFGEERGPGDKKGRVYGFDESMANIKSARKNALIAGVEEGLELEKCNLEEVGAKLGREGAERLIFWMGRKEEEKLNEIYIQANFVLKEKGVLMLVGRENWEITLPKGFKLKEEEVIRRGENNYNLWVMEKG